MVNCILCDFITIKKNFLIKKIQGQDSSRTGTTLRVWERAVGEELSELPGAVVL